MAKKKPIVKFKSDNPKIQKFWDDNGAWVRNPKTRMIMFETGAQCELGDAGVGLMMPPPEDEYELLKNLARFQQIKADNARKEFDDFRDYLSGNGMCPAGIDTDEKKFAYYKKLHAKAKYAIRRYAEARDKMKEVEPFWIKQKRKEAGEDQARRQKFLDKINAIRL